MDIGSAITSKLDWLSIESAAKYFGYTHAESLRRRLRHLREQGEVIDLGNPPEGYEVGEGLNPQKVVILWPHPLTALIHKNAPVELLNPKRGKRPHPNKSKVKTKF